MYGSTTSSPARSETVEERGPAQWQEAVHCILDVDFQHTEHQTMKCVVLGSSGVGKTALLMSFLHDRFTPEEPVEGPYSDQPKKEFMEYRSIAQELRTWYMPHFLKCLPNCSTIVAIPQHPEPVQLQLADTLSGDGEAKARRWAYVHVDVFLIAFSMDDPVAVIREQVQKWHAELRKRFKDLSSIPIILVGTKHDLVDTRTASVSMLGAEELGHELVQETGAKRFMTTSAKTTRGLQELFEEVILAVLHSRDKLADTLDATDLEDTENSGSCCWCFPCFDASQPEAEDAVKAKYTQGQLRRAVQQKIRKGMG